MRLCLIQAFKHKDQYPLLMQVEYPGEVRYVPFYKNYTHLYKVVKLNVPKHCPEYLDNLCRLGLLEIPSGIHLTDPGEYEPLENSQAWESTRNSLNNQAVFKLTFSRKLIQRTGFGQLFIENVIAKKLDLTTLSILQKGVRS